MASSSPPPVVAGTLQTDPRSGGIKRSSGVNVLPIVAETWAQVRNDADDSVDWLIAGYDGASKNDIVVLEKGSGGVEACARALPRGKPVFGGCRVSDTGRFVSFLYADEQTPTMSRARASMHKNGVLNVFEGCDREIEMNAAHQVGSNGATSSTLTAANVPVSSAPVVKTSMTCTPITTPKDDFSLDSQRGTDLAPGVDPLYREQALSDDEFMAVFGMDKSAFACLPGWKRTAAKKANGLF